MLNGTTKVADSNDQPEPQQPAAYRTGVVDRPRRSLPTKVGTLPVTFTRVFNNILRPRSARFIQLLQMDGRLGS